MSVNVIWAQGQLGRRSLPTVALVHPRVNPLVRWAFLLFIFSIPFEYPDRTIPVEITTLTGAVFLLTTFLELRLCYRQKPAALWWFFVYLATVLLSFVLNGERYGVTVLRHLLSGPPGQLIIFVQLLLIFWAGFNLLRIPRISRAALLAFVAACALLALFQLVIGGLPGSGSAMGKVSILGQNANRTAQVLGPGLLLVIGVAYTGRSLLRPRMLAWGVGALLALAVIQTGSRGGILAMGAGLLTIAASAPTLALRIRNAVVVTIAMAGFTWMALRSPTVSTRFEKASEGDLAGREAIYPAAWRIFLERPLIGWGPTANKVELASRLVERDRYQSRDTHNILLEVLTATGLLGAIPFLTGTGLCMWAGWRARRGMYGMVPFALTVTTMVGNMSHNYIAFKLHWVILAFALACGAAWDYERKAARRVAHHARANPSQYPMLRPS